MWWCLFCNSLYEVYWEIHLIVHSEISDSLSKRVDSGFVYEAISLLHLYMYISSKVIMSFIHASAWQSCADVTVNDNGCKGTGMAQ